MRAKTIIAIYAVMMVLLSVITAGAITVTPSPVSARVGQNVNIAIASVFPGGPSTCQFDIIYGDGSVLNGVIPGPCVGSNCTNIVNHAYASPGIFAITVNPIGICGLIGPIPGTASVTVSQTSLTINRLELYFTGSRRGETTVPRNEPGLRAAAAISYTGSGLLQGRWEIDGRIIGRVFQHLTFRDTLTLEMPPGVTLPTFDPGTHTVQFIIETPAVAFQLPLIIYFVTPDEAPGPIKLILPKADDVIPYAPARFEWEGAPAARIYLVRFLTKPENTLVFSAYSATPFYLLPEMALKGYFTPGRAYVWEVRALDAKGETIATSPQATFSFREQGAFVKGHVIVVLADGAGEPAAREIAQAYGLKLIDTFPLSSIESMIALLDAGDADIFSLIEDIRKDRRVLGAQPDFIFSVNSDSLREIRNSGDLLRIERLHKHGKGKGMKVAIIDTGVDNEHPELKRRISFAQNYVRGEHYAAEQHGTAVAGLIAADGREYSGVAPASEILALRACRQLSPDRSEGECTTDGLARALDAAIIQKAQVINMSFGSGARDPLLVRLIEQGAGRGILLVAPVGNRADMNDVQFPASHPSVIAVAGLDERQNPWPNSTLAGKAAVAAPAVNLLTTIPGNKHNFLTGTSFSSALISGLLALALERDRGLTRNHLPVYANNLCEWEESLLKISLCDKKK